MKAHWTPDGGITVDLGRGFGKTLNPDEAQAVKELILGDPNEISRIREEFYQG